MTIFFLLYSMNVGGVERSLLNLLSTLSPERYEVSVGLVFKQGELLDQIPDWVQVHEILPLRNHWKEMNDPPLQVARRHLREGHIDKAICFFFLYFDYKFTGSLFRFFRYIFQHEPSFPKHFDLAVAYAGPSRAIDYYICHKVDADQKWGWIHFDISKIGIDTGMILRLYGLYRRINVVSQEARDVFLRAFPQFADKTFVRYNSVNPERVLDFSQNAPTFDDDFSGKRILTVGRISEEKGHKLAILAMKQVLKRHPDVRWFFVGTGKDLATCQEFAQQEGVDNSVIFLGLQTNPYGFMRDCDLYVQPSLHEGYCITLAEVLCFNKPVVATAFAGAREQLEGKNDAWISDFSPDSLTQMIDKALTALG